MRGRRPRYFPEDRRRAVYALDGRFRWVAAGRLPAAHHVKDGKRSEAKYLY